MGFRVINPWTSYYGRRVETLRLAAKLTNAQLRGKLKTTQPTYNRIRYGYPPRVEFVRRLIAVEAEYAEKISRYKTLHPQEMGGNPPVDTPPPTVERVPARRPPRRPRRDNGRIIATGVEAARYQADELGRSIFGFR